MPRAVSAAVLVTLLIVLLALAAWQLSFIGFMGVLLATPLLLVPIVLVRMIHVEDVLGDRSVEAAEEKPAQTGS